MSTVSFYLPFLLLFVLAAGYFERKMAAFIQDRLGPTEVGYWGLGQPLADLLKLLQKERIVPTAADKVLFVIAPAWIFVVVFAAFAVLPVTHTWRGVSTTTGVLYLLAMTSLESIGIFVAGWASNNKYARMGAMRALLQFMAYEIPLVISVLSVLIVSQTLDLQAIAMQQGLGAYPPTHLLGISSLDVSRWGGVFTWNIVRIPPLFLAYILFFVASLAACHRAPFDLPEAESELVGGYHTEYSGLRWAWLMLAEYSMMLLMSLLGVILFLGGWHSPLPNLPGLPLGTWTSGIPGTWISHLWAGCWLFSKALFVILLQMVIRWTLPRLRFDQVMWLCWQRLTPAALLLCLITLWWKLLILN
ncbi:MAG: complex I subunit 1/NuoH family protein [Bacteroidota bacterium]